MKWPCTWLSPHKPDRQRLAQVQKQLEDAKAQRPHAEQVADALRTERIRNNFGESAKAIFRGGDGR
jgi:hypothetical protein